MNSILKSLSPKYSGKSKFGRQARAEGDEGTIQWLYRPNSADQVGLIAEQVEEEKSALDLKSLVMDGLGDNDQLNGQWIRHVDAILSEG